MKKLDLFTNLAVRIVLFSMVGLAMTYLGDYLRASGFFGDRPETGQVGCFVCDGVNWGARHYWYVWSCFALFMLGLVRLVSYGINEMEK